MVNGSMVQWFNGNLPIGLVCQWFYSMKIESGPMVLRANDPTGQ